ncbi:MAG: hypothetical protein HY928_01880 [Elusimicrobia bacterium]|nr:hypothetical protein [Elusimicrobiota bacterium]
MKRLTFVLAVVLARPDAAAQQSYTVETYYPSPSGVYSGLTVTSQTVVARDGDSQLVVGAWPFAAKAPKLLVAGGSVAWWWDFGAYRREPGQTQFAAPPDPAAGTPPPGRFFYNQDDDRYYYASRDAQAADRSTWYKPVGQSNAALLRASVELRRQGLASVPASRPLSDDVLVMIVFQGEFCGYEWMQKPSPGPDAYQQLELLVRVGGNWRSVVRRQEALTQDRPCVQVNLYGMVEGKAGERLEVGIKASPRGLRGTVYMFEAAAY